MQRVADLLLKQQAYDTAAPYDMAAAESHQGQGDCSQAASGLRNSPAKPWTELSIEGKIERLREQVKASQVEQARLYERVSALERTASRAKADLVEHRHASDDGGKVMLPANSRTIMQDYEYPGASNGESGKTPPDPSKVYF